MTRAALLLLAAVLSAALVIWLRRRRILDTPAGRVRLASRLEALYWELRYRWEARE
jgi:hypothetical protein